MSQVTLIKTILRGFGKGNQRKEKCIQSACPNLLAVGCPAFQDLMVDWVKAPEMLEVVFYVNPKGFIKTSAFSVSFL